MHIVYNESLANCLLTALDSGSTIIATNDLFQKNSDNMYLQTLPVFFAKLGLSEYPEIGVEYSYNRGKMIFLDKEAQTEDWKNKIKELIDQ